MKCLVSNCACEKIHARGLCLRCYTRLKKRVSSKVNTIDTWEKAEERGQCLPSRLTFARYTAEDRRKNAYKAINRRKERLKDDKSSMSDSEWLDWQYSTRGISKEEYETSLRSLGKL